MKTFAPLLLPLWLGLLGVAGCTATDGPGGQVTCHDRNHDGKVDLENHHYPRRTDADWQLRDDDFDGRYEQRMTIGVGIFRAPVDVPVPVGVRPAEQATHHRP